MIIKSLLDTDLYKLTMQQFVFHFSKEENIAEYAFKCRSGEDLREIKDDIIKEMELYKELKFQEDELTYLKSLGFFKDDYIDFLKNIDLYKVDIIVKIVNEELVIRILGDWKISILFEVPILSIVQELYLNKIDFDYSGEVNLDNKIIKINQNPDLKIAEFGTRRRASAKWQKHVLIKLKEKTNSILGTSNVMLAKELNLKPIGTMAHEFFQGMQVLASSMEKSEKEALYAWNKEYGEQLDTALTDIFGMDYFLEDLSKDLALMYSGYRHDSGDAIEWGYKLYNKLKSYNIDTKNIKVIFSDGLNIDKAIKFLKEFEDKFIVVFGIGTNLTNDFDTHKAVSLVIKMVNLNNSPTAKISDSPGKLMCEDPEYVKRIQEHIKEKTQRS